MRTKRKPASGPAPWGIHESGGFMPDPNDPAIGSKPREWPDPKIAKWIDHALTDAYVEAAVSFADGAAARHQTTGLAVPHRQASCVVGLLPRRPAARHAQNV